MKNEKAGKNVKIELPEVNHKDEVFEIDGDFFIKVVDDGLYPLVKKGDFLCVKETTEIEHGDFVFLRYCNIFRAGFWWESENGNILQFTHPNYEPMVLDSLDMQDVKIIGRVTAVYHPIINEYKVEHDKFLERHDLSD